MLGNLSRGNNPRIHFFTVHTVQSKSKSLEGIRWQFLELRRLPPSCSCSPHPLLDFSTTVVRSPHHFPHFLFILWRMDAFLYSFRCNCMRLMLSSLVLSALSAPAVTEWLSVISGANRSYKMNYGRNDNNNVGRVKNGTEGDFMWAWHQCQI